MLRKKPLCALVIGHKQRSPGASNPGSEINEFQFNDALAQKIEQGQSDVDIQRVYRRTLQSLPNDINELNPDYVVSLHCNASTNHRASGSEVFITTAQS